MRRRWTSALERALAAPLVAAGFLTVIPIPVPKTLALGPMGWPVACFPLVGAVVGGLVAAVGALLAPWFPPSVVAALMVATLLAVTGALHLDALMDSFDGMFGGRDPAGRLAIMRDSRVGSYGIAAAGSLLLIEYSALATMTVEGRVRALVVAAALSRWAMAVILATFPAGSTSGLAAGLKPHLRRRHMIGATVLAAVVAIGVMGWTGAAMLVPAGLLVFLGGRLAIAKIGGVTGDVCGGLGLVVEATVLLACVAISAL